MNKNINEITETIKILIYKEEPKLFEKINFYNEDIYLEPLLFAYFNNKDKFHPNTLYEILQGYFTEKSPLKVKHSSNDYSIAYLPKIGYVESKHLSIINRPLIINETKIELLIHPTPLLDNIFKDANQNQILHSKIEISERLITSYLSSLTNAFSYIKSSSPEHFGQIEGVCKKVVLFRTAPENTNSFATINAHGIAFFNVYQEHCSEVFFVDDIAHQTGHIIMTSALFNRKEIFKIDENEVISKFTDTPKEYRSFYVLFHALYTYYTTLLCLENCIDNNLFKNDHKKEAIGRVCFYLKKFSYDLDNFNRVVVFHKTIGNVLTEEGVNIFRVILEKYNHSINRWQDTVSQLCFEKQTYNYNHQIFKNENSNFNT